MSHGSASNSARDLESLQTEKVEERPGQQTQASKEDAPSEFIEVGWDERDPEDPRSMSKAQKWLIVLIGSTASLCVTCTSSLYTLTYDQLRREFGVSEEVCTLGLSLYTIALGIGPLFTSPLSEFYGRKPICLASLVLFVIWMIPCAVAQNIQTLLIARFISGVAGSSFLSVSGGTVGDLFAPAEVQTPMLIYTTLTILGPVIGPIVGGFINQFANWRWSFWVLLIWAFVLTVVFVFFNPETYRPVLLRRKAHRLRRETEDQRYRAPIEVMDRSILNTVLVSCTRPFELLVREYMVLCLSLLTAIVLGIMYLFFGAFAYVFEEVYHFELYQIGLSFLGIGVGIVLGAFTDRFWQRLRRQQIEKNGGVSEPEYRLPPAAFGAIFLPVSLFWFGWTARSSIHWIVPLIGSVPFGLGGLLIFLGVWTFFIESYQTYAASALAANVFVRLVFAAAFPLFGIQMYENLGIGWATSLLGFLALATAPFPTIFMIYGKRIRAASQFAKS